jgi:hypothetical protein
MDARARVADFDGALVPLGRAAVRRAGSDVTIVGAARVVEIALEAADALATEGVAALDVRGRRIPVGKRRSGRGWIAVLKSACWTPVRQLGTFARMVTRPTGCSWAARHAQALR